MSQWRIPALHGKKAIINFLIESPLYFTMPLTTRLEIVKRTQNGFSYNNLRDYFLYWIKTGYLK